MIIVLNGAFGVGKTTTARLLVRRLPGAVHFNPERIGALVRALSRPFERADDFQDLRLWLPAVAAGARLSRLGGRRTLVVPLTVYCRSRCRALLARLRAIDRDVRLFRLVAAEATLRERILGDVVDRRARAWRLARLDACLAAMRDPALGTAVETDGRPPSRVAAEIMRALA